MHSPGPACAPTSTQRQQMPWGMASFGNAASDLDPLSPSSGGIGFAVSGFSESALPPFRFFAQCARASFALAHQVPHFAHLRGCVGRPFPWVRATTLYPRSRSTRIIFSMFNRITSSQPPACSGCVLRAKASARSLRIRRDVFCMQMAASVPIRPVRTLIESKVTPITVLSKRYFTRAQDVPLNGGTLSVL